MGNKHGKDEENQSPVTRPISSGPNSTAPNHHTEQRNDDLDTMENKSKIPRDLFVKFINCMRQMPFEITEEQFQQLANLLQVVTFDKNETVLQKGENGKGIFLVVNGHCKVISDDDIVIRIIEDEDYFGEISSFYDRPCSASVITGEDNTKMLLLPHEVLDDFMERPVRYPLIDLFTSRRYLDLENTSMKDNIIKEITRLAMINAPPFHNWSSEAIDSIIGFVVPQNVVFFPAGADIFFCGDADSNGHLLLQGSVELFDNNQESFEVLNAGPQGLWFGDEQLFCMTKRNLTARAHTPCIVATFSASNFQTITQTFPLESSMLMNLSARWKKMVEIRDSDEQNNWKFGMEKMRLLLRRTQLLEMSPSGLIYNVCLGIKCKKLSKGETLSVGLEHQEGIFIVLSGSVNIESDDGRENAKYEPSGLWFGKDNEGHTVRATQESIIGMFDKKTLSKAHDMYPDAIINWGNNMKRNSLDSNNSRS